MKNILLFIIHVYQTTISPYKPSCCRFYPTCSAYACEAVRRYGAIRGGMLSLRRILRCQPWCKGGVDPVPDLKRRRKTPPGRFKNIMKDEE